MAASHAVSRLTHNKMHLYEHGDRTDELIPRSVSNIRGMPKVPSKFVFKEHVTNVKKVCVMIHLTRLGLSKFTESDFMFQDEVSSH